MAARQSWTDWLLGTQISEIPSSDINPSTIDQRPTSNSSQTMQTGASQSTTSPYGPFVRVGRGGAGNFTWNSQQFSSGGTNDLEAQEPSNLTEQRSAAAAEEHLGTKAAIDNKAAQKSASQFIRVGRDMVQSNELPSHDGASISPTQVAISNRSPNPSATHFGRGGAGNHAAAAQDNEKATQARQEKEQAEIESRRARIEQEIHNVLPAPQGVWFGGKPRINNPQNSGS